MSSHAFVVVSLVVCIFDNQALVASDLVALQTTNQLRGFPWEHGSHDQLDLAHLARFGRLPCPKADCWCVVHNGVVAWTLGVVLSGESLGETRCWLAAAGVEFDVSGRSGRVRSVVTVWRVMSLFISRHIRFELEMIGAKTHPLFPLPVIGPNLDFEIGASTLAPRSGNICSLPVHFKTKCQRNFLQNIGKAQFF